MTPASAPAAARRRAEREHVEAIAEVARVLIAAGWVVVYDVRFRAEMADVPQFETWMKGDGSSRYRPVAKHEYDDAALAGAGFECAWETELRRDVEMSPDALVEYLMTHSERIAAIREGLKQNPSNTGSWRKASFPRRRGLR